MNLQIYLDFATELAYHAGRITLGYFNTALRTDFKPDSTPVTEADRAAEAYIRSEIQRVYPGHAIVGEEFGEASLSAAPQPEKDGRVFRWIIDPIDGTKSFIRGVPLYGVLIGLEIEAEVHVGAAYFPALDEMLSAAVGSGAWLNGRRAHVSKVDDLSKACICYTTYKNFEKRDIQVWKRLVEAVYMTRGWSDAYGYLLVATGRAEACLDPYMNIWDCGPFPVILREAGGYFGNWRGREGHTHGEALATNGGLKQQILDLIAG